MKIGVERGVVAAVFVVVAAVVLALSGVPENPSTASFPYGPQAPSECSEYGTMLLPNGSYWFCDATNESWNPYLGGYGGFNVTFADVEFTVGPVPTFGVCGEEMILGREIDGTVSVTYLFGGTPACPLPSPITFSPDHVFAGEWLNLKYLAFRLLVRVTP